MKLRCVKLSELREVKMSEARRSGGGDPCGPVDGHIHSKAGIGKGETGGSQESPKKPKKYPKRLREHQKEHQRTLQKRKRDRIRPQ